ncbi:hypothetical protein A9Q84_17145 [Halobacteriovorax marinus]|uniref:DUF1223 domain-containing protein n=1 Tax=Halobacteriovorax marinus TaxID=97084 RepID=A0A1Y5F922_9BACT|nr:hypothetical protein A9Q84_17145 [Halobacteriovorax marinus]
MKKLTILLFLFSQNSLSCEESYQSTGFTPQVIELYTSEGCSSCPPADRWMNSLKGDKRLWKEVFPLKFHVDYWDYIGWKDVLAKSQHTQRQRNYASTWKSRNVYTPGFVLNGREWRSYFSRKVPVSKNYSGPILKVKRGSGQYEIEYKNSSKERVHLSMAILGSGIKHKIRRGENAGKFFNHNFAVLDYRTFSLSREKLNISIPTIKKGSAEGYHAVFWVEKSPSREIIQATGGCALY